jgi:hypothetical protein
MPGLFVRRTLPDPALWALLGLVAGVGPVGLNDAAPTTGATLSRAVLRVVPCRPGGAGASRG